MRSSLAGLSERLASLGEQISGFSAELDSVERDLRAGMTAIAQELEATRALQARIDLLESQTAGVRKSLEELRGEVDAVREGIDLANQEAASVNQAVGRTNASIQQLYVLLIAVGISTPSLVAILLFLFRRRLRH
jgi:chromosome segregation ATPase